MDDGKQLIYTHFVAGAAALAVLEDGDVAAGRHAVVGRQVDVLDPARAAVVGGAGAVGLAVPGGPGGEPLAVVVGRDVGATSAARTAATATTLLARDPISLLFECAGGVVVTGAPRRAGPGGLLMERTGGAAQRRRRRARWPGGR